MHFGLELGYVPSDRPKVELSMFPSLSLLRYQASVNTLAGMKSPMRVPNPGPSAEDERCLPLPHEKSMNIA